MDARPETAVVVVNWNAAELTQRCLDSLAEQSTEAPVLTVVVDNGSTDDSADTLERRNPAVPVLRRPVNGGFGAGVNEALRSPALAGVRYVVLLNNDAIAEPGLLDAIVRDRKSTRLTSSPSCRSSAHCGVRNPTTPRRGRLSRGAPPRRSRPAPPGQRRIRCSRQRGAPLPRPGRGPVRRPAEQRCDRGALVPRRDRA